MPHDNRPGSLKPLPVLDLLIGKVVLGGIRVLNRRANRRGDAHEAAHLAAMQLIGMSDHRATSKAFPDGYPCAMREFAFVTERLKRGYTGRLGTHPSRQPTDDWGTAS